MSSLATPLTVGSAHPVRIDVEPLLENRNRLTTAFRLILALPHLVLVGGPIVGVVSWSWGPAGNRYDGGIAGGALGAVAAVIAIIAWFSILFVGQYPKGLRDLVVYYLRWRVRVMAYTALLRDEYPPFGEGAYPVTIEVEPTVMPRNRLTVAFRLILSIPHVIAIWALGFAWAIATMVAWFSIVLTGRYPDSLYDFSVGVLRWTTRVEAYLLLLHDEYPPFSLS